MKITTILSRTGKSGEKFDRTYLEINMVKVEVRHKDGTVYFHNKQTGANVRVDNFCGKIRVFFPDTSGS